jgi:hypothetical protein
MSAEQKPTKRRRRGSVFFPIVLIVLGVVLLLSNLGVMKGNIWEQLLQLWPVLLIAGGLDSIYRGEGIAGALMAISFGVLFLMSNFGYLDLGIIQMFLLIWPLLLVSAGLDIMTSRKRNLWTSLIAAFVILGLLAGTLWLIGVGIPQAMTVEGEQVSFDLQGASSAQVKLIPGAGEIKIKSLLEEDLLLAGTVPLQQNGYKITQTFDVSQDGKANLELSALGSTIFYSTVAENKKMWDLGLTSEIPVGLTVELGAGEATLNLEDLNLRGFNVGMGAGKATIYLPEKGSFEASVNGGVGELIVYVPAGMAVKIQANTALVSRSMPSSYIQYNNQYTSPGFDQAENRITLVIGLAIGNVHVIQK